VVQVCSVQVFGVSVVWPATVFREMVGCRKIPGSLLNDISSVSSILISGVKA